MGGTGIAITTLVAEDLPADQADQLGEIRKEYLMENQNQSQKSELGPNWVYRGRCFANLLRMGHCAPTVMQSILDISSTEKEWLVKLSAGMPGGIGNTGFECGAVTSPLALLGIHYSWREVDHRLPAIFDKGHALCQHFFSRHKTFRCREIRVSDSRPPNPQSKLNATGSYPSRFYYPRR
jgi:C_GCAxxG_C_C family probable redox protein